MGNFLLKAENVRIVHCDYGKTDNNHSRCTTNSVLGLFVQSKPLKRSYPSLFARLEFKVWDFRSTTFFELAVCLSEKVDVRKMNMDRKQETSSESIHDSIKCSTLQQSYFQSSTARKFEQFEEVSKQNHRA
jgi:hypothetical protein